MKKILILLFLLSVVLVSCEQKRERGDSVESDPYENVDKYFLGENSGKHYLQKLNLSDISRGVTSVYFFTDTVNNKKLVFFLWDVEGYEKTYSLSSLPYTNLKFEFVEDESQRPYIKFKYKSQVTIGSFSNTQEVLDKTVIFAVVVCNYKDYINQEVSINENSINFIKAN